MYHTSEACALSCPRRLPHSPEEWCAVCRAEHDRYCEDQCALESLHTRYLVDRHTAKPTDAEWHARLDDVAPLVTELAQGPIPASDPGWFTFTA